MSKERIEVGKQPLIIITECSGDLIVRSWAETAVLIKGDECQTTETDAGLTLSSHGDIKLMVPLASSLVVENAQGNAAIKKIEGSVSLQNVAGDTQLTQTGAAKIGSVYGDLAAKAVAGSLSAEEIYGDAAINKCDDLALGTIYGDLIARSIRGTVQINVVMGDASLRAVSGDAAIEQCQRDVNLRELDGDANSAANVMGDIRLHGPLSVGKHTFAAQGDIVVRWPVDGDLTVTAVAPHIKNRLPLLDVVEIEGTLTGSMGDSGVVVNLQAGDRIELKESRSSREKWADAEEIDFDFDFDLGGLSEMLNEQVLDRIHEMTVDLETKFGPEFSEKIAQKAERAAAKAEKAAEKALRRAERSMKRGWPSYSPAPPRAPKPPKPPKRKASSEEQLKILKMVENGIISPDEAGTLLQALEN
ncbi:MAG: hypothetical protein GY803_19190 [Chloroflexi bacterium]|nr:hypothetical protein [Chloroflexota bacterium]